MGLIKCGQATCDEQGLVKKEGRSTPLTESLEQASMREY